jgi:hypothetical protein
MFGEYFLMFMALCAFGWVHSREQSTMSAQPVQLDHHRNWQAASSKVNR